MSKVVVKKYNRTNDEVLLWWRSLNNKQKKLCIDNYKSEFTKNDEAPQYALPLSGGSFPKSEYWSNQLGSFTKEWVNHSSYKVTRVK